MKVGVISLGCDKNRVDTEWMLGHLTDAGYRIEQDPAACDVLIVNTCAFIDQAKREAIDTVLEMAQYKDTGACKCLVVTGCLPQRYMCELESEMPEVDIWMGTARYGELPSALEDFFRTHAHACYANDRVARQSAGKRVLTTPYHYAYLKIAEGCSNGCTYCAIPSIRGKFTSRPIEEIVEEAQGLIAEYGVKELILVAQDVGRYGQDLYGDVRLIPLLQALSELDVHWIRLLYLYPERVSDELLDYMAHQDKICKYLDMPCQHYSDMILSKMHRKITSQQLDALIGKIRSYGCFTLRSTFIVGFPQESEEDYRALEDFIRRTRFDRCGFFAYSKEDGTLAARMEGQIPDAVKKKRLKALYAVQREIMCADQCAAIGQTVEVLYDGIDYDRQMFVGRTQADAPDVDAVVYFTSAEPVEIGNFYTVRIVGTDREDRIGERI